MRIDYRYDVSMFCWRFDYSFSLIRDYQSMLFLKVCLHTGHLDARPPTEYALPHFEHILRSSFLDPMLDL